MTDLELKRALTADTQRAADRQAALKEQLMARLPRRTPRRRHPWLAVAAMAALAVTLAAFTPPGQAAAAAVGQAVTEAVTVLIETMFPPKEVTLAPEGQEETVTHMPHGEEPDQDEHGDPLPGYVIYVDDEIYTATETGGVLTIAMPDPIDVPDDDGLPLTPCRMTVEHRPDLPFDQAADTIAAELSTRFAEVADPADSAVLPGALYLRASDGVAWDDAQADVNIAGDGQGGVYVLTAQYFLEAEEGHGARFAAMAGTFALVPQPDS